MVLNLLFGHQPLGKSEESYGLTLHKNENTPIRQLIHEPEVRSHIPNVIQILANLNPNPNPGWGLPTQKALNECLWNC